MDSDRPHAAKTSSAVVERENLGVLLARPVSVKGCFGEPVVVEEHRPQIPAGEAQAGPVEDPAD